jgi:hypothetical protein
MDYESADRDEYWRQVWVSLQGSRYSPSPLSLLWSSILEQMRV